MRSTQNTRPIRVLIVDDRRAIGEALARAVDLEPDLHCVGVATNGDDLAGARDEPVDVVVVDLTASAPEVVAAVRRVRSGVRDAAVLVVADDVRAEFLAACVRAGATGVLRRGGSLREILDAVRAPVRGAVLVDSATLASLPASETGAIPVLTEREMEVLHLLGEGHDPRTIADELHLSVHTARGYVKAILAKLGAHTQLEAVVTALRLGLLEQPHR